MKLISNNKIGAKGLYACRDCLIVPQFLEPKQPKSKRPLCTMCDGQIEYFASRREFKRWSALRIRERAGDIDNLEIHPKYPLLVYGVDCGTYTPDSRYFDGNRLIVEDVKGHMNSAMKQAFDLRRKLVKALYQIDITVVR